MYTYRFKRYFFSKIFSNNKRSIIGIKIILFCLVFFFFLIYFYSGCFHTEEKLHSKNVEKIWRVKLNGEDELSAGYTSAFSFEEGFLILPNQSPFFLKRENGEKIWELEGYTPMVADKYLDPPLLTVGDNYILLALRKVDYQKEGFEVDNLPCIVKANLESGELAWEHPLARNTPPLNVSKLYKLKNNREGTIEDGDLGNEYVIAEGNFARKRGHESDKPVYGAHAEGLAIHRLDTGQLVDAFFAHFGSIFVKEGKAYYTTREIDNYRIVKKDLFQAEKLRELEYDFEKNNEIYPQAVAGITNDLEVLWSKEGKLLEGLNTKDGLVFLLPGFILLEDYGESNLSERRLILKREKSKELGKEIVYLLKVLDGKKLEEYELKSPGGVRFENRVFLQGEEKIKALDSYEGKRLWEKRIEKEKKDKFSEPALEFKNKVIEDFGYYPLIQRDEFLLLDLESGEKIYSYKDVDNVILSKEDKELFLICDKKLKMVKKKKKNIEDKNNKKEKSKNDIVTKWKTPLEELENVREDLSLELENEGYIVFSAKNTLVFLERSRGERIFSYQSEGEINPLLLQNDRVLVDEGNQLVYLQEDS